ncbi:hypothetical protein L1887_15092 [Cichorium endivia]|nr:hypothetical protein L1887_15092 [Cichorium endivia]
MHSYKCLLQNSTSNYQPVSPCSSSPHKLDHEILKIRLLISRISSLQVLFRVQEQALVIVDLIPLQFLNTRGYLLKGSNGNNVHPLKPTSLVLLVVLVVFFGESNLEMIEEKALDFDIDY